MKGILFTSKHKEILSFATLHVNMENIMLSETSQEGKYCFLLTCEWPLNQSDSQTQSGVVVAESRRLGRGGMPVEGYRLHPKTDKFWRPDIQHGDSS